ncbi:MAG: divalent-cation tolerance protein CutA [Nitrospirota bacterium]
MAPLSHSIVVLITFPSQEEAKAIAAVLVNEKLAACVNVIGGIQSFFIWEGVLQDSSEVMGVVKTTQDRLDSLVSRVRSLHSYSVPEIIAVPIVGGDKPYLQWVGDSVSDS